MREPLPILILIALIVVAIAAVLIMTWNIEPWWRKFPTPRRRIDDDKDAIKQYKIRRRHPEVFGLETRRHKLRMIISKRREE